MYTSNLAYKLYISCSETPLPKVEGDEGPANTRTSFVYLGELILPNAILLIET